MKTSLTRRLGIRPPAPAPVMVPPAPVVAPGMPSGYRPPGAPLVTGAGAAAQAVPLADARTPAPVAEQEQEGVVSRALRGFNKGASRIAVDPTFNPLGAGLIGGASALGEVQQDSLERRAAALAPQNAIDLEVRKETARRQAGESFDVAKETREHKNALELAEKRAANSGADGGAKIPFDWKKNPDGTLSPVDGGPSDRKIIEKDVKRDASIAAAKEQSQRLSEKVAQALAQVGHTTAGAGSVLDGVPLSGARTLKSSLDTIKAILGFEELRKMRAASPTGGALGQVAVKELEFLQAAVSSLDQGLAPDDLSANLLEVQAHAQAFLKALAADEARIASGQQGAPAAPGRAPAAGGGGNADPLGIR